jgi:hypothetical protein
LRVKTWLIAGALALTTVACSQTSKKEYKPTETQGYKLQLAQKDAIIAKQAKDVTDANFNKAYTALQNTASQVVVENKWPKDLIFSPDKLDFTAPVPLKDQVKPVPPTSTK